MRYSLILASLVSVLCLGCDIAARQQRGEDARRLKTEKELRELGEKLHNNQNAAPASDSVSAEVSKENPASPADSASSSE
jgi:hypothetical protein